MDRRRPRSKKPRESQRVQRESTENLTESLSQTARAVPPLARLPRRERVNHLTTKVMEAPANLHHRVSLDVWVDPIGQQNGCQVAPGIEEQAAAGESGV